ncbi:MAG: hypothetical protein GKR89_33530 [Candidatus Latescibacteria bacterium]|nr:hypothetical protein [Candidatus Latescibacterota bacterium]
MRAKLVPVEPYSVEKIVSDGRHNAFAAFIYWQGAYWLAFRQASGHIARDGDIVVLRSADARGWRPAVRFDVAGDDRDPQWAVIGGRLWLYINSLDDGRFESWATGTDGGETWSAPQRIYQPGYIFWKPIFHQGRLWAGAHAPGTDQQRRTELVVSADGLDWEQVSIIRAGQGESETALYFDRGRLTAFLRNQTRLGGDILQSESPFTQWNQQPAQVHLSGHVVYEFDGVVYLISRLLRHHPPAAPATPQAELPSSNDQGTMVYTYEDQCLRPYCQLGPLQGNHDSSYATAVRQGNELLVVFHRAANEFAGPHRARDAADLYLARVPLQKG